MSAVSVYCWWRTSRRQPVSQLSSSSTVYYGNWVWVILISSNSCPLVHWVTQASCTHCKELSLLNMRKIKMYQEAGGVYCYVFISNDHNNYLHNINFYTSFNLFCVFCYFKLLYNTIQYNTIQYNTVYNTVYNNKNLYRAQLSTVVDSEARAVAGRTKGGYTLRVVREVRCVFSRRLMCSM